MTGPDPVVPLPQPDWGYFFDLDGTLLDIAASPDEACIDEGVRELVAELYARTGGAVVLISGRSIADIDRLFSGSRLPVAGQHGLERRDHSGTHWKLDVPTTALESARDRIAAAVKQHPGLLLEYKGLSLALHYRAAPELAQFARDLVYAIRKDLGPEYGVQEGKAVVELKAGGRDKGAAVLEFLRDKRFIGRRPVFVGDDTTDEFAFAAVNELDGLSIKVGPGPTAARWRLEDVAAVRQWLEEGLRTFRQASRRGGAA